MAPKRQPGGLRRENDPPLLILVSLADGPKHGHALARDIEGFADVTLGPGALYGAITRLEERGLAGEPGSVTIAAGYLVAILTHVLGVSHARQTGAILAMLTALTGLAGLALLAGLLATLPVLIRLLRAGRRPKVRRGLVWAAGA